jgi:hypothetical protein
MVSKRVGGYGGIDEVMQALAACVSIIESHFGEAKALDTATFSEISSGRNASPNCGSNITGGSI